MNTSRRTALVTGASAGIGRAFTELLASEGYDLVLVARRRARLDDLAATLQQGHQIRCHVIDADLSRASAPDSICTTLEAQGIQIDLLINNAGFAAGKTFLESNWHELQAEMQVMMGSVTELIHRLAPGMQSRGWGRIINVSSLAAFAPPGPSLLYSGIKSYVLGISESLDMELKPSGIHVTALCPGFTWSEFHDVQGTRDLTDRLPGILWQDADDVVRAGYQAVMRGQPVCIPGNINKLIAYTTRTLPEALRYRLGRQGKMVD